VSKSLRQGLEDIRDCCVAIQSYAARDPSVQGMTFDAVCMRVVAIGEATTVLDEPTRARAPEVPWDAILSMRNHVAHGYFDTVHDIVRSTVHDDVPVLLAAVERLLADPTVA